MAAEDEGRTEEASPYKIEKARKEGRVAKSQEVSGALILLLSVVVLIFLAKWILNQLLGVLEFYFIRTSEQDLTNPAYVRAFFEFFIRCVLPVCIISAIAAFGGNVLQTRGIVFSLKPIEIKFSNIVPRFGQYFKKTLFSRKGFFNFFKSIGKVAIIVAVAFFCIRKDIFVLLEVINNGDLFGAVSRIAKMGAQLLIIVSIIFLVISIPDYFIQRKEFLDELKMTKQEVKEEYKEMEGDPEVKGKLQQMQRKLLSQNIPKAVSESDVVITNPTHYAVALKYDTSVSDSPQVNAKGVDEVAQTIKRLARENNIPIVEDRPTARGLYTETDIGDIIPVKYYKTIALIYSHLEKFKQN